MTIITNKKKLQYAWVFISILACIIIYLKLKPKTKKEIIGECNTYYSSKINGRICKAYYGRVSVIVELCDGKKILWQCGNRKFSEYRDNLKSLYSSREAIEPFERIDSIYKPLNSFDFYIYIDSNPDSLIVLKCDYDCNEIMKERNKK